MIIAFKKVFRCGYHDKPSLLVTQRGSSPGVKLTVWVWVPQIIEYLCLHHSEITRYMYVFHCIDIIFNLIHLQETAMRWNYPWSHNVIMKIFFSLYQTGCKLPWNCFSCLVQEEPGRSGCSLSVLKFINHKLFIIKFIEGEQKIHRPGFRPSGNWYHMKTMLSLKQRVNRLESQMTTHVIN